MPGVTRVQRGDWTNLWRVNPLKVTKCIKPVSDSEGFSVEELGAWQSIRCSITYFFPFFHHF